MEPLLKKALTSLGCSPKATRLYLAAFRRGPSSLPELARSARLQRSTTYLIADELLSKSLLEHNYRDYNRIYTAAPPSTLRRLLAAEQRKLGRTTLAIDDNIEQLLAEYDTSSSLPTIQTWQGANGLIKAQNDILTAKSEVLLWTNQATERDIFSRPQHQAFIDARIQRQLAIRVLTTDNPEGRSLVNYDSKSLRQTRLLPKPFYFSAETYLYDDKIVILDFTTDLMAILIRNRAIYQAQRAQFEIAWQTGAEQV